MKRDCKDRGSAQQEVEVNALHSLLEKQAGMLFEKEEFSMGLVTSRAGFRILSCKEQMLNNLPDSPDNYP